MESKQQSIKKTSDLIGFKLTPILGGFICQHKLHFVESTQLMWACSHRTSFLRFSSEHSFTDLQDDKQLQKLLACGEWFSPVPEPNLWSSELQPLNGLEINIYWLTQNHVGKVHHQALLNAKSSAVVILECLQNRSQILNVSLSVL